MRRITAAALLAATAALTGMTMAHAGTARTVAVPPDGVNCCRTH
jgi:hypothetical protein